ncbi:MAG: cytidine/deoxycytidylate deaminase family protein [Actinobacteria bacterium]|nr:cytidine/deoxycytidylate deaminase family protein [Actinomycetota bacterium]
MSIKPDVEGKDLHQGQRLSNDARPSWDEYFLNITKQVAERSTCLRRKTGSLLVRDKRILATGYNGAPSGVKHCYEVGCLREAQGVASGERHELCRGLHAEQNALIQAALHGIAVGGASIYCTHQSCSLCAKMLINSGIKEIIYEQGYPDALSQALLAEAGVRLLQVTFDHER